MIWLILLVAFFMPSMAESACTKSVTTFTCTGDLTTLRALFNTDTPSAVLEGDTVHVTAGTWTWTGSLVIGEVSSGVFKAVPGFTFEGEGPAGCALQNPPTCTTIFKRDPTTYTDGVPGGFLVSEILPSSGLTTFKDFGMDASSVINVATNVGYLVLYGSGLDKFRVTNVAIYNLKQSRGFVTDGNRSATGALEFSGLFDHVSCTTLLGASTDCFAIYGNSGQNQNQYLFQPSFGSNHSTYVEDSISRYGSTADDTTDAKYGTSLVYRYNTSNFSLGVHGADSSARGMRVAEIYRNVFTTHPTNGHYAQNWRTGPNFVFDNVHPSNSVNINFTLYRPMGPYATTGKCDGTNTYDGNLGTGTTSANGTFPTGNPGWPCLDQTGWFFPTVSAGVYPNGTHAQYLPAYLWANTAGVVSATYQTSDNAGTPGCSGGACGTYSTGYVVADRDYFKGGIVAQTSSSSPFDGTTGVGFGTLARRPATCTTATATNAQAATLGEGTGGVGYWATDQGSWNTSATDGAFNPRAVAGESGLFYKCTATNTWTLAYTPYTYPHPLQGSAPAIPAAPTGLRTLGTSTGTSCTVTWAEAGLSGLVGYHVYYGTTTGTYTNVYSKTAATSAAAHQPPRQHTFHFPVAGTYYITVTGFSDTVADTAAATEVTCTSTGLSRTAASNRSTR